MIILQLQFLVFRRYLAQQVSFTQAFSTTIVRTNNAWESLWRICRITITQHIPKCLTLLTSHFEREFKYWPFSVVEYLIYTSSYISARVFEESRSGSSETEEREGVSVNNRWLTYLHVLDIIFKWRRGSINANEEKE